MPNWPGKSPEDVCVNNEIYNTGRYPISENNHWHSGIHISSLCGTASPEVYPFIGGELAAYRISREFKTVPRRKKISSKKYDKLSNEERKLYIPSASNDDLYELKADISEEERNEKHCNNYILLKYCFCVKKQGSETYEPINFFILYTNIVPALPDQFEGNYYLSTAPKKIPFYFKYRFYVKKNLDNSYKYTTISTAKGNIKLFPFSHCTFWEKDSTTYYCNFVNFDDPDKIIEIPKGDIEELNEKQGGKGWYVPKELGVPIYNLNMSKKIKDDPDNYTNDLQNHFIAILTTSAYFTKTEDEGKFLRVIVNKNEVNESGKITVDGTKVLVKKTDLILKTKGRLKNDNSFCSNTMKGLMVYDEKEGNARDILVEETEFELAEPEEVLQQIQNNYGKYFRLKTQKYILYEKPYQNDPVEVKIEWDNLYKQNEAVTPLTSIKTVIYEDTLLGYGYQPSFYKNDYYDVALFFKDIDFMDKECEANGRYFMPPMVFYEWVKEDGMNVVFNGRYINSAQVYIKTGVSKMGRHKNTVYIEFFYEGEKLYLPSEEAEKYKIDMLDWKKFFRMLDGKVEKIEDASDGLKFIKEKYNWDTDSTNVGALLEDSNPNWWSEGTESKKTKLIKRSIICGHPLELDKEQYIENDSIKLNIQRSYGLNMATSEDEDIEYFKNMVKAIDVWGELKVSLKEILGDDKNNFWFAHPVYFINHLDRAGVINKNIDNLKKVQDKVIKNSYLQPNTGTGIFKNTPAGSTFCNQAAYLTIKAVDKNYKQFIGNNNLYLRDDPPWDITEKGITPEFKEKIPKKEGKYEYKESTIWYEILEEQAKLGILVKLSEQQAQEYANMGYVVIAAWRNLPGDDNHPHYATARPGFEYDLEKGTMLANVGSKNDIVYVRDIFSSENQKKIYWYYNPNQIFQNEINAVLEYYGIS